MAGIEIDIDSDEFQERYKAFTTFPSQAISEAQYQINAVINKYLEGGNRTNVRSRAIFMACSVTETLRLYFRIHWPR